MNEVIELAFEDDALRQLLKLPALRQIGLFKQEPRLWLNSPKLLQTKFERSMVALADINAEIKCLIQDMIASEWREQARILGMVRNYLRCVPNVMRDVS